MYVINTLHKLLLLFPLLSPYAAAAYLKTTGRVGGDRNPLRMLQCQMFSYETTKTRRSREMILEGNCTPPRQNYYFLG